MTGPQVKFNRLIRDPNIEFVSVEVCVKSAPNAIEALNQDGKLVRQLGTATAIGRLPGWADTQMVFRVICIEKGDDKKIILGHRVGLLDTPILNARRKTAERLWCTGCWDPTVIPFYLYYRHIPDYSDPLQTLPGCLTCGAKFQTWEADTSVIEGHSYIFTEFVSDDLTSKVSQKLIDLGVK